MQRRKYKSHRFIVWIYRVINYMFILSILFVLFINNWSWEILSFNLYLFFLIWLASVLLFLALIKKSTKLFYIYLLVMIPILIVQWKTTNNAYLSYMDATEKYTFTYRKSEFPVFTVSIFNKTKTINSALYIANERTAMLYKLEQNLLRTIDLNLYFFGNHPRERAGIREFEKYSFLFIPLFMFGLYQSIKAKTWQLLVSLLTPLTLLSFVGQDNPVGPFSLFPFFTVTISIGILFIKDRVNKC